MIKEHAQEGTLSAAAKLGGPLTIAGATVAGYPVSELVLWTTLIYTVLMIVHKAWQMWKDFRKKD
jgi:hypothetical protein